MIPAIRAVGVTKRFRALQALAGVDLEVAQGEFFGLLGPNGAGKTTLISALAGLARADSGSLAVMGHDVVSDYRAARLALEDHRIRHESRVQLDRAVTRRAAVRGGEVGVVGLLPGHGGDGLRVGGLVVLVHVRALLGIVPRVLVRLSGPCCHSGRCVGGLSSAAWQRREGQADRDALHGHWS